jgi:hypothetical protein
MAKPSLLAALSAAQTGDAGGLPAPSLPPNFCPSCGEPMTTHGLQHGPDLGPALPPLPGGLQEMQGSPAMGAKKKVAARAAGAKASKFKPKTKKSAATSRTPTKAA